MLGIFHVVIGVKAEQQRQALEHQTLIAKRKMAAEAEAEKARKEELFRMQVRFVPSVKVTRFEENIPALRSTAQFAYSIHLSRGSTKQEGSFPKRKHHFRTRHTFTFQSPVPYCFFCAVAWPPAVCQPIKKISILDDRMLLIQYRVPRVAVVCLAIPQEESARRREALRLETERELRTRKMELEQEMDAAKLQVLYRKVFPYCNFAVGLNTVLM